MALAPDASAIGAGVLAMAPGSRRNTARSGLTAGVLAVAEMTHSGEPTLLAQQYLAAKFEHPDRSRVVAEQFAALVTLPDDWHPDLIVPVPSSTAIAGDFAVALGERLGIRVGAHILTWQRDVPPLKSQPVESRADLVRDAFAAASVTGVVLLVDDVVRSGATFAEAERALRVAGAARVECLAMLRVRL